ncbi:MAG: D-alanyl-D-alanine carboxypeptidase [Treponema sp.]|nr:D-alanyl-D-alanine carboxypeptidase [Treponema sp.]
MEIYSETRSEQNAPKGRKKSGALKSLSAIFKKFLYSNQKKGKKSEKSVSKKVLSFFDTETFAKINPLGRNKIEKSVGGAFSKGASSFSGMVKKIKALSPKKKKLTLLSAGFLFVIICTCIFINYKNSYKKTQNVSNLSDEELAYLDSILDETYTLQRSDGLKPLPYPVNPVDLDVWAGSAILIDASNGCVIFEKNADAIIPPASITKIFVIYIVLKDIHDGKVSFDDIVPLPEKSWAVNMPSDASLMFLGQGQIVTLKELLLGLAVASGNDAAIAVARYISGGTEEFVARMNAECAALGLKNTHFVEPSGYDENNLTCARDLAKFARIYINEYPESIDMFHSAKSIRYPLQKNLPAWQKDLGDSKAVYQKNTNPLLGEMEGVDGIKTGFIYESGYNLALTAKRDGNRFISITMQGPGKGSRQGNQGRVHDGHEMMDFAFASFADYVPSAHVQTSYTVPVPGGMEKFVRLVPAWDNSITVPRIAGGEKPVDDVQKVQAVVTVPKSIYGEAVIAKQYGQIQYKLGDIVLETVPLVSDRSVQKGGLWKRFWGLFV